MYVHTQIGQGRDSKTDTTMILQAYSIWRCSKVLQRLYGVPNVFETPSPTCTPHSTSSDWWAIQAYSYGHCGATSEKQLRETLHFSNLWLRYKIPEAIPLKSIDAPHIAEHVVTLFFHFGVSEEILTDQVISSATYPPHTYSTIPPTDRRTGGTF